MNPSAILKQTVSLSARKSTSSAALRRFSKFVSFSTLFLIFAGGLVTSTGSGLAVPDWPLSYGTLFPPMVGGIVYEHSHRMIAATVGLFILILTVWIGFAEERRWVRNLSIAALTAVVCQGILGGLTVLFFLPKPISILHAVLAQSFFVLTIFIAYSQSLERRAREQEKVKYDTSAFRTASVILFTLIYLQLILGALMRHTHSGLAIPDFPTMAGSFIPHFDSRMLAAINNERFLMNLDPVNMGQVVIHFLHRLQAFIILIAAGFLTFQIMQKSPEKLITRSIILIDAFLILQITFGAITIWSQKGPFMTSLHVATGAAVLGLSVLLLLRIFPVCRREL